MLPSVIGWLSIVKEYDTLGNLWFSTINTLRPFFNSNSPGISNVIAGAGPGFGCLDLSIWADAEIDINNTANKAVIFVFISIKISFYFSSFLGKYSKTTRWFGFKYFLATA